MDVDEVVLGLALHGALCAKKKKKYGMTDCGKMKSWFLWSWFDKNIRLGCFPSGLPLRWPKPARVSGNKIPKSAHDRHASHAGLVPEASLDLPVALPGPTGVLGGIVLPGTRQFGFLEGSIDVCECLHRR